MRLLLALCFFSALAFAGPGTKGAGGSTLPTFDEALADARKRGIDTIVIAKNVTDAELAAAAQFASEKNLGFAVIAADDKRFDDGVSEVVVAKARPALPPAVAYHEDYDTAVAAALKQSKSLIVWVAIDPNDYVALAKDLSRDALHLKVDEFVGDRTPRIVVQGGDDRMYFIRAERLRPESAAKVRSAWTRLPVADSECATTAPPTRRR